MISLNHRGIPCWSMNPTFVLSEVSQPDRFLKWASKVSGLQFEWFRQRPELVQQRLLGQSSLEESPPCSEKQPASPTCKVPTGRLRPQLSPPEKRNRRQQPRQMQAQQISPPWLQSSGETNYLEFLIGTWCDSDATMYTVTMNDRGACDVVRTSQGATASFRNVIQQHRDGEIWWSRSHYLDVFTALPCLHWASVKEKSKDFIWAHVPHFEGAGTPPMSSLPSASPSASMAPLAMAVAPLLQVPPVVPSQTPVPVPSVPLAPPAGAAVPSLQPQAMSGQQALPKTNLCTMLSAIAAPSMPLATGSRQLVNETAPAVGVQGGPKTTGPHRRAARMLQ